ICFAIQKELFLRRVLSCFGDNSGLFEPNKREKNTKKKLFEGKDCLYTSFVRNLNSFLNSLRINNFRLCEINVIFVLCFRNRIH
ncbi:MAG: hypothetical protein VB090_05035, partial [Petrimonas sp.]|nr:hypothetical protein [Petrimonas sp.]